MDRNRGNLVPGTPGADEPMSELEMKLNGVSGGVRETIVTRIRAIMDKNPEGFAKIVRHWINEGRRDD